MMEAAVLAISGPDRPGVVVSATGYSTESKEPTGCHGTTGPKLPTALLTAQLEEE
jgi:hypothetical protein